MLPDLRPLAAKTDESPKTLHQRVCVARLRLDRTAKVIKGFRWRIDRILTKQALTIADPEHPTSLNNLCVVSGITQLAIDGLRPLKINSS
jgi:hypothetical protein